ncbi:uroporphyrinogen-III synthase [Phenylobacterium sp. LjRoot219]|uniref:uroporphyrinogen-III synthase n=1 Tax=Phenylobacterium sp. LjRoot219 TaxID=3342283 RepID=UPI003F4F66AB
MDRGPALRRASTPRAEHAGRVAVRAAVQAEDGRSVQPPPIVWVARTEPGASRTAAVLSRLGHAPAVAPVLRVEALRAELSFAGVGALAFTSPNGVTAFVGRNGLRDLPVYAVGDATAEAARAVGFHRVQSAGGDVRALAERRSFYGAVLRPGALEPAGDLVGALRLKGVEAVTAALYRTRPVLWTSDRGPTGYAPAGRLRWCIRPRRPNSWRRTPAASRKDGPACASRKPQQSP